MRNRPLTVLGTVAGLALLTAAGAARAEDTAPAPNPLELYARIERDRAAEVWLRQQHQANVLPYATVVWPPRPVVLPYWMPYPPPVYPVPAWGPWCGPSCWPYPITPVPHPPPHER